MKRNVLIAHGGGPTSVMNASLFGVIDQAAKYPNKIGSVHGAFHGIEGVLNDELFDLTRESPKQIALLPRTPSSIICSCRHKVTEEEFPRIVEVLKKHNIGYFLYNGGNDSMDTCWKIAETAKQIDYDLTAVGIPKTIDNDLGFTDNCPGYGSAARYIASSVRDLWMDTQALPLYVNICETMGRNAGWLTAAASLAEYGGKPCASLIYLPERKLAADRFLADVERVLSRQREVLVVVSEGLLDENGHSLAEDTGIVDEFGHKMLSGVGNTLCKLIMRNLKVRARAEKHGFVGRACALLQSETDREEAIAVGRKAIDYAVAENSGVMVTLTRECDNPFRFGLSEVPLKDVANVEKYFPDAWITEDGTGVTADFKQYAAPLIGGKLDEYTVLEKFRP